MPTRYFQNACALSGFGIIIFYLIESLAAGSLPAMPPSWGAKEIAQHYRDHERGNRVSAVLLLLCSSLYLAQTALMSAQIRRIPHLNDTVWTLQLITGTTGGSLLMIIGSCLAITNYRLDRPDEITQTLNDQFWIIALLSWPPFMVQDLTFAYAILTDSRPKPLFPKPIAVVNIIVCLFYLPSVAIHCVTTGPLAWNGAFGYWIQCVTHIILLIVNSISLLRAVSREDDCGEDVDRLIQ